MADSPRVKRIPPKKLQPSKVLPRGAGPGVVVDGRVVVVVLAGAEVVVD